MRILVDQNAPRKYVEALRRDATDAEIAQFAENNGWVVFTNDDDFFVAGGDHGLILYDQIEDPAPGNVVAAVEGIVKRISHTRKSSKACRVAGSHVDRNCGG